MAIQLKHREPKKSLFREGVLGDIDLSEFIVLWSYQFPMDKLFREKHNIPFNSELHRRSNPIDMMIEIGQDMAIVDAVKKQMADEKDPTVSYNPGRGKYFKKMRKVTNLTQNEIDKAFDQIDIDDIKINDDGTINL